MNQNVLEFSFVPHSNKFPVGTVMGRRERKDTIIAPKEKLLTKLAPLTAAFVLTSSRDGAIIFVSYFTPQFILAAVSSRMEPALAEPCENTGIQCALQERDQPCLFPSQEI